MRHPLRLASGVAIASDVASITQEQLRHNVDALCRDACFREAADELRREFAAYNAPSITGDLLEELGSTRAAVLRKPATEQGEIGGTGRGWSVADIGFNVEGS